MTLHIFRYWARDCMVVVLYVHDSHQGSPYQGWWYPLDSFRMGWN